MVTGRNLPLKQIFWEDQTLGISYAQFSLCIDSLLSKKDCFDFLLIKEFRVKYSLQLHYNVVIFFLQKFDGNGCKMINGYGKKSATTTGVAGKCSIEEEDNKILEPKEELQYLSEALGFQVTYTEFPQKNTSAAMKKSVPEFITLVKLSTKPPKVSHQYDT